MGGRRNEQLGGFEFDISSLELSMLSLVSKLSVPHGKQYATK